MEDKNLWKLRGERGTQPGKPISHLGGLNIFWFVNKIFWPGIACGGCDCDYSVVS